MNDRLDIAEFIIRLRKHSKAAGLFYEAHLKDNFGEALPYVFMGQFIDSAIATIDKDKNTIEELLSLVESALRIAADDLHTFLVTTVSETVDSHVLDQNLHARLLAACGPILRSTLIY